MTEYKKYRRKQVAEMRPYKDGDDLNGVSISDVDRNAGSPKPGDMIARNPKNYTDKWLVAANTSRITSSLRNGYSDQVVNTRIAAATERTTATAPERLRLRRRI